jgi:inhibitor of KinA
MTLTPLGDSAVVVALGSGLDETGLRRVRALAEALERDRPVGVVEVVPAFANVTVFYDVAQVGGYEWLCREIATRAERVATADLSGAARVVEIPVWYGGEGGVDLADVAAQAGLSSEDVVALHAGSTYLVQAIGFAPGFAYLGGLPAKIHTPRRPTPRTVVPAGTVGIGGAQTGVYPLMTPGGWNLIGRTPLRLFDGGRHEPALLRAGDRVTFRAINAEEFAAWR